MLYYSPLSCILFYPILLCHILSYSALSYPALSYPALSYPVLSYSTLDSFYCSLSASLGVGNVIPLHNGHNGWPSEAELASLTDLILLAGFPLECHLSGKNQSQDFSDKQKRRGVR
jgi:hypothetical protein